MTKIGTANSSLLGLRLPSDNVVVTARSERLRSFRAQEQDRSAGVRVVSTTNPPVNTLVSFTGKAQTDADNH